jgi:hypothetical protein
VNKPGSPRRAECQRPVLPQREGTGADASPLSWFNGVLFAECAYLGGRPEALSVLDDTEFACPLVRLQRPIAHVVQLVVGV